MDKYLNRSRFTAVNSNYSPSYLYSSAKAAALSRYSPALDITPLKFDLETATKTNNYVLAAELNRATSQQTVIRAQLDRRRALESKKILCLRDEIDINQNILNAQRDKQRSLVDELALVELEISDLLKKRQFRQRKQLGQLEELDIRASDVTRDLQDSQFRLDAHDAMIRGLEKIVLAGK